ncbi:MAG: helix-turn-helix domain-containing protein [Planctomycetales bacterium]|nr:helix-turn-helix domain-containing protein [Planctomycetales bacterium]
MHPGEPDPLPAPTGPEAPAQGSTPRAEARSPAPEAPAAAQGLPGRLTWTAEEAAQALGTTLAEFRRLARRQEVPGCRRLGRAWLVTRVVLLDWIAREMPEEPQRRACGVVPGLGRQPKRRR